MGSASSEFRVPYYEKNEDSLQESWKWLESTAETLKNSPALIIGDLNVRLRAKHRGGEAFARILESGWTRAVPSGEGSYRLRSGNWNEIDHALASPKCRVITATYCASAGGFQLAGLDALSDHAALIVDCEAI